MIDESDDESLKINEGNDQYVVESLKSSNTTSKAKESDEDMMSSSDEKEPMQTEPKRTERFNPNIDILKNTALNISIHEKKNIVPGNRSYSEVVKSNHKVIVIGDSIPRGIRVNELNYWIKGGYTKFKCFQGLTTNELFHYIDPTLKDEKFDSAILHVGVVDILKSKNKVHFEDLIEKIRTIAIKCISFEVSKFFISGIAHNNKISDYVIKDVNSRLIELCNENSFIFIDNSNILQSHLYDGLHF